MITPKHGGGGKGIRITQPLNSAIAWLEKLVAMDTRNGTGDEIACARFLASALEAHKPDEVILDTVARSRGKSDSGYVMARWGRPKVLLNVHIDTVPSGEGWDTDPLVLTDSGDTLIGLGASDIKGAAACILAALETIQPKDTAILFSGDEEHGSEVMPAVIKRGHFADAPMAIVCEPTGCQVGRRHRGILAFSVDFSGPGGHSSLADVIEAPLLSASRLAAAVGDYGETHKNFGTPPYQGLCTNIGQVSCDGSYNVVPTTANLRFSMRPPPGDDVDARERDIRQIAADTLGDVELDRLVSLLPFETRDVSAFDRIFGDGFQAIDLQYWTEAALLADAGVNCVVFGPGDIGVAHRPNEFVPKADLARAIEVYARALAG